jgi:hypothetical protein
MKSRMGEKFGSPQQGEQLKVGPGNPAAANSGSDLATS